jgi:hypothetical protein
MLHPYTPAPAARPVPTPGSCEHRRLHGLTCNPWFTLDQAVWLPAWNQWVGDVGKASGWVIPGSLN